MIDNMIESIKNKEDVCTFSVEFPKALAQIRADDAEFEIVVSNNTQKLILYNRRSTRKPIFPSIVTKTIGLAVYKPR